MGTFLAIVILLSLLACFVAFCWRFPILGAIISLLMLE